MAGAVSPTRLSITGHTASVTCIATLCGVDAADGLLALPPVLATGSDDNTIRVYALETIEGESGFEVVAHLVAICSNAPAGLTCLDVARSTAIGSPEVSIVAGTESAAVVTYMVSVAGTGGFGKGESNPVQCIEEPTISRLHDEDVSAVSVCALQHSVLAVSTMDDDGVLTILDPTTGHVAFTRKHAHEVLGSTCIWYKPDATGSKRGDVGVAPPLLLTGGFDQRFILWDVSLSTGTGKAVKSKGGGNDASDEGSISILAATTKKKSKPSKDAMSATSTTPRRTVLTAAELHPRWRWQAGDVRGVHSVSSNGVAKAGGRERHTTAKASGSGDGASGCESTANPASDGKILNPAFVHSASFSPTGAHVGIALGDGSAAVYDVNTGERTCNVSAHSKACTGIAFSKLLVSSRATAPADSSLASPCMITVGDDGWLRVWPMDEGWGHRLPVHKRADDTSLTATGCSDCMDVAAVEYKHGRGPNGMSVITLGDSHICVFLCDVSNTVTGVVWHT